jgi:cell division protein FtsW (lipid II flippase)
MIPLEYFGVILLGLIVAKYFKEGFTPTIIIVVIFIVMLFIGEINKNQLLVYLTAVAVGIHHFLSPKFYWLPDRPKLVGFREDSVENELYYG